MAIGDSTLSISGSSTSVPSPSVITAGQRIKVTSGSNTDYYAITNSPTGQLVTGVTLNWVDCDIQPTATHTHSAGDKLEFRPYVVSTATIPSQTTKVGLGHSVNLTDYFNMVGGKDSDLSFIARPGGSNAQVSVSQSTLAIAGNKAGTISVTVTAFDRSQGRVNQTFSVIVTVANRAPESVKAIGNPTIGVGEIRRYDLDDYFRDPDGDTLSYQTTGIDRAIIQVTQPGSELNIRGRAKGDVTLLVESTDQFLTISQQMHVTVPANRRPIRTQHVNPVALSIGGLVVLREITDSFSDPDGGQLRWLAQWEEGDKTHQYRQEFWTVDRSQGTNLLYCVSHFQYPPGAIAPWKSGNAWIMPAGTDITLRTATTVDTATATSYRLTAQSAATARWNGTTRRVEIDLRTSTAIPAGLAPPSRVLLGTDADKAWIEGDMQSPMNFIPGDSYGSRTAYVKVWDFGTPPLFSSDLFQVALGQLPVTTAIDDIAIFTGSTYPLELTDHFVDPDGDNLKFGYTESRQHISQTTLVGSELRLYGLTTGNVDIDIIATDPIGLTSQLTFNVTVTESAATKRTPLITPFRAVSLVDRRAEDVEFDFDGQLIKIDAIVLSNAPVLESPDRPEYQVGFPSNYSIVISDLEIQAKMTPIQRSSISEFNLNVPTEILAERDLPSITVRGQTRYPVAVYRAIESGHTLYWRINLTSTRLTTAIVPGWALANTFSTSTALGPNLGGDTRRIYITIDVTPWQGVTITPRADTLNWEENGIEFNRPNWLLPDTIFRRPTGQLANDLHALVRTWRTGREEWRQYFAAAGYEIQQTNGIWHRVNFDVYDKWGYSLGISQTRLVAAGYERLNRPALPGFPNRRIFRMQHYIDENDWVGRDVHNVTIAPAPNIRFIDGSGNVISDPIQFINRNAIDSADYRVNEDSTQYQAPSDADVPGVPTGLTLTGGQGHIAVTWTTPRSDGGATITGYDLDYRINTITSWSTLSVTGTAHSIIGLTNGTYDVRVAARNNAGLGSYTLAKSATVTASPTIPVNGGNGGNGDGTPIVPTPGPGPGGSDLEMTSITVNSTGLITATWNEASGDYRVRWGSIGVVKSKRPIKNVTNVNTTTLQAVTGGTHVVQVARGFGAYNPLKESEYTAERFGDVTKVDVPFIFLPKAPTGLRLDIKVHNAIHPVWGWPDSGGYLLPFKNFQIEYRAGTTGDWTKWTLTDPLHSSDSITGLSAGIHQVRIAAITSVGQGPYSAPVTATVTTASVPGIPRKLTLDVTTAGQIGVNVNDPVSDGGAALTGWYLEWRPGTSGSFANMTVPILTRTPFLITGLAAGAYQVKVAAINSAGTGLSTAVVTATVKIVLTVPDAPTGLTLVGGNTQFTASWTAPVNDGNATITGYILDYRLGVIGNWTSANVTGLTTTITGLTVAGSYQVRVAAVNSVGTGGHSASHLATVTAVLALSAPQNFAVTLSSIFAVMTWTAPASDGGFAITKYQYRYSGISQTAAAITDPANLATGPVDVSATVTTTSRIISGPRIYYFAIRAVNSHGNGPYSTVESVKID